MLRNIAERQVSYLKHMSLMFRHYDKEGEGKITEEQLRSMVSSMSELVHAEIDWEELIVSLDPAKTNVLCYSPVMEIFS